MMITRVNEATAPRPGLAPDVWSLSGASTYTLGSTIGWDGLPVSSFRWRWPASGTATDTLSLPLPGLVPGDRYCWFVAIAPGSATPRSVSIMGGAPVVLNAYAYKFYTGSFVATGNDQFTIAIVPPYTTTETMYLFVDTLLIEERHVGSSGRYFDGSLPGARWDGTPSRTRSRFAYDMDPTTLEPLSPFPLAVVEADIRPPQPWEFTLDRSSLDGTDVLPDLPRWATLPSAKSIDIRRGRTDPTSQVQAGELTVVFDNYDGLLDPDSPMSPYRPNPSESYLARGTRVRVSSLGIANALQFTVSSLFTGNVDDWAPSAGWAKTVTLTATDDLATIGTTSLPPYDSPQRVNDTTADRVRWVCATAGVDLTVSPGASRALLGISGGGSMRTLVDQAANAEAGRFYVDARGRAQLTVHADEYTKTPAVTITDQAGATRANVDYEDISVSSGVKEILNQVTVDRGTTVPAGQMQTISGADPDSIARHGAVSTTVDAPLADPATAADLANYLAHRTSKRAERVTGLPVNIAGQKPMWAQQCVRMDLGTFVEVVRHVDYNGYTRLLDQLYSVEGISHSITPQSWLMTLTFGPVDAVSVYGDAGAFQLDSSALDGLDVLTPY